VVRAGYQVAAGQVTPVPLAQARAPVDFVYVYVLVEAEAFVTMYSLAALPLMTAPSTPPVVHVA